MYILVERVENKIVNMTTFHNYDNAVDVFLTLCNEYFLVNYESFDWMPDSIRLGAGSDEHSIELHYVEPRDCLF